MKILVTVILFLVCTNEQRKIFFRLYDVVKKMMPNSNPNWARGWFAICLGLMLGEISGLIENIVGAVKLILPML